MSATTKGFNNELVVFKISEYLPGEYVLRVFPLISKSLKSRRFSLSLLGPFQDIGRNEYSPEYKPRLIPYGESEIYGIFSKWRNFKRIVTRGHTITGLMVRNDEILQGQGFNPGRIEQLYLPRSTHFLFSSLLSVDRFPMLTKIVVDGHFDAEARDADPLEVVSAVWKLPLTSLAIMSDRSTQFKGVVGLGLGLPPVFAHTLRSIKVKCGDVLDVLAPYCRNLQEIDYNEHHSIMDDNAVGLTCLTLRFLKGEIDLTRFTELKEMHLCAHGAGGVISSRGTHPNIHHIVFSCVESNPACEFLKRCPALQHLSVAGFWREIADMVAVLDRKKCKQLTIKPCERPLDCAEVLKVMRGFQFNQDLLLSLCGDRTWDEINEMCPLIKDLEAIEGESIPHALLNQPSMFSSFHALSSIHIYGPGPQWDQENLALIGISCPMLKDLKLETKRSFSGTIELQSRSLCKVHLDFSTMVTDFNLQLPNLTYLTLRLPGHVTTFLRGLLDGDPLIQLPLLRVLFLFPFTPKLDPLLTPILCKVGHPSLAHLKLEGSRTMAVSKITFQNVPSLRSLILDPFPSFVDVCLDIPGECDVELIANSVSESRYAHEGGVNHPNFLATLRCDGNGWVTKNADDGDDDNDDGGGGGGDDDGDDDNENDELEQQNETVKTGKRRCMRGQDNEKK